MFELGLSMNGDDYNQLPVRHSEKFVAGSAEFLIESEADKKRQALLDMIDDGVIKYRASEMYDE